MTPRAQRDRLVAAGWRTIPNGYLPEGIVRRIEREIEESAPERERILAEEKRPGRPSRSASGAA